MTPGGTGWTCSWCYMGGSAGELASHLRGGCSLALLWSWEHRPHGDRRNRRVGGPFAIKRRRSRYAV